MLVALLHLEVVDFCYNILQIMLIFKKHINNVRCLMYTPTERDAYFQRTIDMLNVLPMV